MKKGDIVLLPKDKLSILVGRFHSAFKDVLPFAIHIDDVVTRFDERYPMHSIISTEMNNLKMFHLVENRYIKPYKREEVL